jgi:hypothetical protein
MGYLDKMHKKAQIDKTIREIMNSPKYRQAVKKDQEQAAMRAYCNFCLMACDFLELRHNYGSRGLRNFLEFAVKRLHYIADDNDKYYEEMNQYFVDKFKVNVFDCMGIDIKKEGGTA